jgi:hypothetical protein
MEVSGQVHIPAALPPGKEPLVPIGQEAGWVPEPFWTRWRVGNACCEKGGTGGIGIRIILKWVLKK